MFDFISGVVTSKRPDAVVIDVAGVGYACFVSLTSLAQLPPEGELSKRLGTNRNTLQRAVPPIYIGKLCPGATG